MAAQSCFGLRLTQEPPGNSERWGLFLEETAALSVHSLATTWKLELLAEPQPGTSAVALRDSRPSPPRMPESQGGWAPIPPAPKGPVSVDAEAEACGMGAAHSPCAAPFSFLPSPRSTRRRRASLVPAQRLEGFHCTSRGSSRIQLGTTLGRLDERRPGRKSLGR
jgi:hypothetical protein